MKFFKRKKIVKNFFKCPKEWEDMEGTEQVRFCTGCQTKVYNLQGLSEEEAIQFIEAENGELCAIAQYDMNSRIYNGKCKDGIQMKIGKVSTFHLPLEDEIELKIDEAEQRVRNLKVLQKIILEKNK